MKSSRPVARFVVAILLVLSGALRASAQSGLVISQLYGGGGNSGATYLYDYVELYNGTAAAIDLSTYSIQYASATGVSWNVTALTGSIQPGKYFLIRGCTGSATSTAPDLPVTPDFSFTNYNNSTTCSGNMSATAGKVALVANLTALSGTAATPSAPLAGTTCPSTNAAAIVDLIGYGSTATCHEGATTAPGISATTGDSRSAPPVDTNVNGTDFTAGTLNPHNSTFGSSGTTLSGMGSASPASLTSGSTTLLTVTVTPGTSPASTGIAVTANLTSVGGSATQAFYDDGTHGDVTAGDNIFSFSTTVTVSTSGTVNLPATITDAQSDTANASISLTVNVPALNLPIHTIQGSKPTTSSTVSPYVGQQVTTTGVVTAVLSNGFFIQARDSDADSDPSTPEGVDVFTSSAPPAAAAVGNYVSVTATVSTFPAATASHTPATELTSPTVTLISTGAALPAAIPITSSMLTPTGGLYQLTRYEGMRISFSSLTSVSGTNGSIKAADEATETGSSTGYFYAVITGTPRPFREPGIDLRDPAVPGTPAQVAVFDDNPERILVDSIVGGGTSIELSTGAVLPNVTGVLDFTFSNDSFYDPSRLILDPAYNRANITPGITVQPVPAKAATEFTVASYNVERFYDPAQTPSDDIYFVPNGVTGFSGTSSTGTLSTGQTYTSSAVDITQTAYTRRLQKLSLTVRTVLNSPDIVTLEEVENQKVANDIAAQINTDAGTPNLYTAYSTDNSSLYTQDGTGISVGFLVKNTVTNLGVTQFGALETFTPTTSTSPITLNDRPWLVLSAGIKRANAKDYPVTVIVNHMKALTGVNSPTSTSTRQKKELQAEDIAKYIQTLQTSGQHVISGGDFNAFEFSDGFTDTLATYTNVNVLPATKVLQPGVAGLVNPPLTDLTLTLPASQRWSYVEDGNAQVLDHIVVTSDLVAAGAHLAYAHVNADFPVTSYNDATTAARSSDHDIAVGYFTIPAPVLNASLTPTATTTFASTVVGATSAGQNFVLTNTGEGPATITSVAATGDYAASSTCNGVTVAINQSCTVNVVFTPTATGTRTGTVTFTTNITGQTFTAALTGTGATPALPTISPASLDFGSVLVNTTTAAKTVTITNSATVAVTVASIAVTGDYTQTNTCGSKVIGGGTCSVSILFKPTAAGTRAGTLTVTTSGAAATTLTTSLTGVGQDFTVGDASGSASTTVTVAAGNSANVTLTFATPNGFSGTIGLACIAPNPAPVGVTCSVPASVTPTTASTTVTVTFTTVSRTSSSGIAGASPSALMLALSIGGLGMLLLLARRRSRIAGWAGGVLALAVVIALPLTGCTAHAPIANPNGTPAGTYSYTVTATSGSVSHSEAINVVVQ